MTVIEARNILIHLNKWRRDDHVPNSYEMPNPTDIGKAIDIAIDVLLTYINEVNASTLRQCISEEHYAKYSAELNLP